MGTAKKLVAPVQRRLLVITARRFYLEDRSKTEIAEELGVSRFKVARLLEQARVTGVVTITVHDQNGSPMAPTPRLREGTSVAA